MYTSVEINPALFDVPPFVSFDYFVVETLNYPRNVINTKLDRITYNLHKQLKPAIVFTTCFVPQPQGECNIIMLFVINV